MQDSEPNMLFYNQIVNLTVEDNIMKSLLTTLFSTALIAGSLSMVAPALADEHGMRGSGHGMHDMHGKGQAMHHGRGHWKASLSDEQYEKINKLKLDYKKKVFPIKAKIKQAKIGLALLITSDKPKQKDIDKQIDEILKLKGEKMRLKAKHKVEVRKELNETQRVQFDMRVLKKAHKGKKGYHHGHHR